MSKTKKRGQNIRNTTLQYNVKRCFTLAAGLTLGDLPLIKVVYSHEQLLQKVLLFNLSGFGNDDSAL